ncbi:MAG: ABC transporter ATP-binding protein [Eubacteriales bacterium]|nr:ABC transporter ATP-binding protein [Eubacteriales bacterium]
MLITCKNLTLSYNSHTVVENLNFIVNKGDYLCIIGENGAGKTTLMKTLLGIHKISKGEIIFGENITNKSIGYLPQQVDIQKDFPATSIEIIMSGFQSKKNLISFFTNKEKEIAKKIMIELNISELYNKCFNELSGGQKQKVLLARALVANNEILLLDEPIASLDPNGASQMYDIIEELNNKKNITIIMISHDIYEVEKYATHVLYLGEDKFFGTKEEYLKR